MIKPSKYLLAFASLFVLLGTGLFVASGKFLPILLQHTVYYCQSALSSFSMRIPGGIGTFLTGSLLLLIGYAITKLLVSYVKVVSFREKLHAQTQPNKVFDQLLSTIGLQGKAFLVRDSKPFAFCHGMRHPKIYLSTALFKMMSTSELEAILRHEQYHLEHKDPFIMLLAEIVRSLFPFFPLLSDLLHNYQIERELAADYEAIRQLGSPKAIISVLKKLLCVEPIEQYAFAPALAEHETLEVRIKVLTHKEFHRMNFGLFNMLVSIFSIGVFAAIFVVPVQAVELHNTNQNVMMVCMEGNNCTRWCKENETVIPPMSKASNASTSYSSTPASN